MNGNSVKKILILTANPKNTEKLQLEREVSEIQEALKLSKSRDQFTVIYEWAVTDTALRRAMLEHNPQIVHFSGHGAGEQGLALENDLGEVNLVTAKALANLFKYFVSRGVECVVLNACYSDVQAKAIAQHIDYVVGMSQAVGDTAARKFAVGFYDGLGAGWSFEDSYGLGCNAIETAGIPEELTPILQKKSEASSQAVPAGSSLEATPTAETNTVNKSITEQESTSLPEAVEVFFSYSHKDEELRDKLANHLTMLRRQGVIAAWHDREISAGTEWAGEIDRRVNSARVILLLISDDFLASDYCYDIELKRAMERHEAGEALVVPIILRPVDWNGAFFGKLQALPKNAKPVTTWENRDEAFLNIAQGIRRAVEIIRAPQVTQKPLVKEVVGTKRDFIVVSEPISQPSTTPESQLVDQPIEIELDIPAGQVSLDSPLYIERPPIEPDCYRAISRPGALILIKAPRQMGKTSLMSRVLHHGQTKYGCRSVLLYFQEAEGKEFTNLETFLRWFCSSITFELDLEDKVEEFWKNSMLSDKQNCTNYFQRHLLSKIDSPLILALDEVDRLFEYYEVAKEFFSLLRAWHERSKNDPIWQKLRLVIDHSKEVYIPLDRNQSPFNVGQIINLPEFNKEQVQDLVRRHGLNWNAEQIDQLMGMVDGHPYLLREALYRIATGKLTLDEFIQFAPTEEGPYRDHLSRQLNNLDDPKLRAALKRVVNSDGPIQLEQQYQFKLCSLGITEPRQNSVIPLCNLYRIYFRDRLKDE